MAGATPGRLQGCGGPCWGGGYSGIRFQRAGTNPPGWKSSCPGAGMAAQVQRGCGRPGPRPPGPLPAARSSPLPPESGAARPTSACAFPYFYSWALKKFTGYSPRGSFCSFGIIFLFVFFKRGAKPQNYFLAILHRGRENTLQVFFFN